MSDLIAAFDTETTGLVETRQPANWPTQPHPVTIALITHNGVEKTATMHRMIKLPLGAVIHPKAQEVHGISFERTQDEGIEPLAALEEFMALTHNATYHATYNLAFDDKVMRALAHRTWPDLTAIEVGERLYGPSKGVCIMEMTRSFLKIPGDAGAGYRRIKLSQAYRRVLGYNMVDAHDALADTDAALTLFIKLLQSFNKSIA